MLKRIEPYKYDPHMTDEQAEKFALAEWIWNSHSWIEQPAGYFNCEWCMKTTTNTQAISSTDKVCLKNPALLIYSKLIDHLKDCRGYFKRTSDEIFKASAPTVLPNEATQFFAETDELLIEVGENGHGK